MLAFTATNYPLQTIMCVRTVQVHNIISSDTMQILNILYTILFQKVSLEGYNPGECNKENHGKLIIVKDRQDNDKLLVCAEENKVYLWKTTDGKV